MASRTDARTTRYVASELEAPRKFAPARNGGRERLDSRRNDRYCTAVTMIAQMDMMLIVIFALLDAE